MHTHTAMNIYIHTHIIGSSNSGGYKWGKESWCGGFEGSRVCRSSNYCKRKTEGIKIAQVLKVGKHRPNPVESFSI